MSLADKEPNYTRSLKCQSNTSKLEALKAQLDFREKVLGQEYSNWYVFCPSQNKRKLTVDEVRKAVVFLLNLKRPRKAGREKDQAQMEG